MRAPFPSHRVSTCTTVSRRFHVQPRAAIASSQLFTTPVSVASEASVGADTRALAHEVWRVGHSGRVKNKLKVQSSGHTTFHVVTDFEIVFPHAARCGLGGVSARLSGECVWSILRLRVWCRFSEAAARRLKEKANLIDANPSGVVCLTTRFHNKTGLMNGKKREASAPLGDAPPREDDRGGEQTPAARNARVRRRLQSSWRVLETAAGGRSSERVSLPSPVDNTNFYASPDLMSPSRGGDALARLRDAWVRKNVDRLRRKASASVTEPPGDETKQHPSTWYKEFPRQQFAFEWGDATEAAFEARYESRDDGTQNTADENLHPELRESHDSRTETKAPQTSRDARKDSKMRYFSLERQLDGRRAFVAASLAGFWKKYESLPNEGTALRVSQFPPPRLPMQD